mgnify:FL=1
MADAFPQISFPLAVDGSGFVQKHESGVDNDGAAMQAYAKSGIIEAAEGDAVLEIDSVIPDISGQVGDLTFTIYSREDPQDADTTEEALTLSASAGASDPRASGRLLLFRIESNVIGGDFRMGNLSLDGQTVEGRR